MSFHQFKQKQSKASKKQQTPAKDDSFLKPPFKPIKFIEVEPEEGRKSGHLRHIAEKSGHNVEEIK